MAIQQRTTKWHISTKTLERMLREMRQEAWELAVWIGWRIIHHGPQNAKSLRAAKDLARLMGAIQIVELAAQGRGLTPPRWTNRTHIIAFLNDLGITESRGMRLRSGETFEQL